MITLDQFFSQISKGLKVQVTYIGYVLEESISGKPMSLKVINKINGKLKLLSRKNKFLTLAFQLCNVLIQSDFDYSCPACCLNFTKKKAKKKTKFMIENAYGFVFG